MSIKLMSAIFETEFRDLPYTKDGEDHKAKASTCKLLLLAIADHANDYGESAYPGYDRLEIKTALSRQGISDTLQALTQNGLLTISEKPSRLQTNNYTIILSSLPSLKTEIIDESSHLTDASQATLLSLVKPLDPNHPLTIIKTINDDEKKDVIASANHKVDAYLDMMNAPGIKAEARRAAIQSYLGERLHVNTETKAWREFAKYADGQQQKHGEKIEVFIGWLLGQEKFQIQYWPPRRMQEMWPQAFIKNETQERTTSTGYFA